MSTPPVLVLGNVNVDFVLGPVDGWPAIGTEIEVERAEMRAGGSAGNTALALEGLRQPHLLIASTGDDPNGMWLRSAFAARHCDWIDDPGMTTTTVGIVHRGGDRAFFTTPGHLQRADVDVLMARVPVAPRPDAIAIVSGSFLMPSLRDGGARMLRGLADRGWQAAIDPGWPLQGWTELTRGLFFDWLPHCDHVLINDEELIGLTGSADAEPLAAKLREGATLVIKRGADGAMALRDETRLEAEAPTVHVIDTVGAGDTFNAAYLAALVGGSSLLAALGAGASVASLAISTYPRRYGG